MIEKVGEGFSPEALRMRPQEYQPKAELDLNIQENRQQISENYYPADRGLRKKSMFGGTSYLTFFRTPFLEQLRRLGKDDLWMDIGGGELFAQRDYLTLDDFAGKDHAKLAVVSVESPNTEQFRENYGFLRQSLGDRFYYRCGDYVEDISLEELPKADLVSDLFAAMTFSERGDVTLQRELDILQPGGVLFSKLQRVYIRDREGRRVGVRRYAESVSGTKVLFYGFNTLVMQKTDAAVAVPGLELTKFLSYKNVENPKCLDERYLYCERYYVLR